MSTGALMNPGLMHVDGNGEFMLTPQLFQAHILEEHRYLIGGDVEAQARNFYALLKKQPQLNFVQEEGKTGIDQVSTVFVTFEFGNLKIVESRSGKKKAEAMKIAREAVFERIPEDIRQQIIQIARAIDSNGAKPLKIVQVRDILLLFKTLMMSIDFTYSKVFSKGQYTVSYSAPLQNQSVLEVSATDKNKHVATSQARQMFMDKLTDEDYDYLMNPKLKSQDGFNHFFNFMCTNQQFLFTETYQVVGLAFIMILKIAGNSYMSAVHSSKKNARSQCWNDFYNIASADEINRMLSIGFNPSEIRSQLQDPYFFQWFIQDKGLRALGYYLFDMEWCMGVDKDEFRTYIKDLVQGKETIRITKHKPDISDLPPNVCVFIKGSSQDLVKCPELQEQGRIIVDMAHNSLLDFNMDFFKCSIDTYCKDQQILHDHSTFQDIMNVFGNQKIDEDMSGQINYPIDGKCMQYVANKIGIQYQGVDISNYSDLDLEKIVALSQLDIISKDILHCSYPKKQHSLTSQTIKDFKQIRGAPTSFGEILAKCKKESYTGKFNYEGSQYTVYSPCLLEYTCYTNCLRYWLGGAYRQTFDDEIADPESYRYDAAMYKEIGQNLSKAYTALHTPTSPHYASDNVNLGYQYMSHGHPIDLRYGFDIAQFHGVKLALSANIMDTLSQEIKEKFKNSLVSVKYARTEPIMYLCKIDKSIHAMIIKGTDFVAEQKSYFPAWMPEEDKELMEGAKDLGQVEGLNSKHYGMKQIIFYSDYANRNVYIHVTQTVDKHLLMPVLPTNLDYESVIISSDFQKLDLGDDKPVHVTNGGFYLQNGFSVERVNGATLVSKQGKIVRFSSMTDEWWFGGKQSKQKQPSKQDQELTKAAAALDKIEDKQYPIEEEKDANDQKREYAKPIPANQPKLAEDETPQQARQDQGQNEQAEKSEFQIEAEYHNSKCRFGNDCTFILTKKGCRHELRNKRDAIGGQIGDTPAAKPSKRDVKEVNPNAKWTYKKFSIDNGQVTDVSLTLHMNQRAYELLQSVFPHYLAEDYCDLKETGLLSYSYGHPFSRTFVDICTAHALSQCGDSIIDIGSKYHKISRYYPGKIQAYRPPLNNYDEVYLQKYPADKYPNVTLIKSPVDRYTEAQKDCDILAIDCIYYPGVLDFIHSYMQQSTKKCFVLVNHYYGKHNTWNQFNFGEGKYRLYTNDDGKIFVESEPNQNPYSYQHENFKGNASKMRSMQIKNLDFEPLYFVSTSPKSACVLYQVFRVSTSQVKIDESQDSIFSDYLNHAEVTTFNDQLVKTSLQYLNTSAKVEQLTVQPTQVVRELNNFLDYRDKEIVSQEPQNVVQNSIVRAMDIYLQQSNAINDSIATLNSNMSDTYVTYDEHFQAQFKENNIKLSERDKYYEKFNSFSFQIIMNVSYKLKYLIYSLLLTVILMLTYIDYNYIYCIGTQTNQKATEFYLFYSYNEVYDKQFTEFAGIDLISMKIENRKAGYEQLDWRYIEVAPEDRVIALVKLTGVRGTHTYSLLVDRLHSLQEFYPKQALIVGAADLSNDKYLRYRTQKDLEEGQTMDNLCDNFLASVPELHDITIPCISMDVNPEFIDDPTILKRQSENYAYMKKTYSQPKICVKKQLSYFQSPNNAQSILIIAIIFLVYLSQQKYQKPQAITGRDLIKDINILKTSRNARLTPLQMSQLQAARDKYSGLPVNIDFTYKQSVEYFFTSQFIRYPVFGRSSGNKSRSLSNLFIAGIFDWWAKDSYQNKCFAEMQGQVFMELPDEVQLNHSIWRGDIEFKNFFDKSKTYGISNIRSFIRHIRDVEIPKSKLYFKSKLNKTFKMQPLVAGYSLSNMVFGFLFRHLKTRLIVDDATVIRFSNFVRSDLQKRTFNLDEIVQWDEYLKTVDSYKRPLYLKGWEEFQQKHVVVNEFELIMKQHEFQTTKTRDDLKPRNLFNPSNTQKAILGLINYNLIRIFKKEYPEFIHGQSTEQIQDAIQKHFQPDQSFMMWDGGSFDSHQHTQLLIAVDNQCIEVVLKDLCFKLGFTVSQYQSIKKSILSFIAPYKMYYPKSRRILMKGTITGTTFTGHPTRTTFGNTMRMIYYTKYAAKLQGIKQDDIKQYHAGDDVLVLGKLDVLNRLKQGLNKIATDKVPDEEVSYGLGQVFRDFDINSTKFNFLSRQGTRQGDTIIMNRITQRVLLGSQLTNSVGNTLTEQEYNTAITSALRTYQNSNSQIEDLIKMREQELDHCPMNDKIREHQQRRFVFCSHENSKFAGFRQRTLLSLTDNGIQASVCLSED